MKVLTPPMGWNSWNTFGPEITDQVVRETAQVMKEKGYLEAGYNYVVIDDVWSLHERDEQGRLVPDPAKFPRGMKDLSDYVHGLGFKFGMYSCAGVQTCAGAETASARAARNGRRCAITRAPLRPDRPCSRDRRRASRRLQNG